jgi:hypothetical protein
VKRARNTRRKTAGAEAVYARERREAQREKDARWIGFDRALEIAAEEGVEDGADHLRVALKQGLLCRFQHRERWWMSKPIEDVAPLLAGRNPLDLENGPWKLVVHEEFWRKYVGRLRPTKPALEKSAPVEMPAADVPTDKTLPPPKTRATKRTTIDEYTAFQNDYLKKYNMYASKDAEAAWAKAKGCSPRHVRDVLRPKYRDSLPVTERAKFQSHTKKPGLPAASDDGPPDDGR